MRLAKGLMNHKSIFQALEKYYNAPRWVVAFSGGRDSHVLLHMLARLEERPPIHALHINHQLSPNAVSWQTHAAQVCADLGLAFHAKQVSVQSIAAEGLEAAARSARYVEFEAFLDEGDVIMLGHHQDDQAETLLLRLMRGSGPLGLAAMPQTRALGSATLLRPLLQCSRRQIQAYAVSAGLVHINDESNDDLRFDRNYLRRSVLPLLEQRWPQFAASWQQVSAFQAESASLLFDLGEQDLQDLGLRSEVFGHSIDLYALKVLSAPRQRNALRTLCSQVNIALPPRARLAEVLNSCVNAKEGASPRVSWADVEVRRFNHRLYVLSKIPAFDSALVVDLPASLSLDLERHTRVDARLLVEGEMSWAMSLAGVGRLSIEGVGIKGAGSAEPVEDGATGSGVPSVKVNVAQSKALARQIRFRQGGERFTYGEGQQSKRLKSWMQEHAVPPWLRGRLPLLYEGSRLCAIGDYWSLTVDKRALYRVTIDWRA